MDEAPVRIFVRGTATFREEAEWQPDLDALEDALEAGASFVLVTNPNNPTGTALDPEVVSQLLARGRQRVDSALGAQPAVQQELLAVLGTIHRQLGLYPEADSLFERAVDVARREGESR